ncbi:MAG TPA: YitT family protein [Synergistaceae bacterium]|nr:YitT family protein [Synergistaceae bacterium]
MSGEFRAIIVRVVQEVRREWTSFLAVTAGVAIQAFAMVLFVLPNEFPDLGVSGVAVLSHYALGLSPSLVLLALNTLLMVWAWRELSPRFVLWTAYAVMLFSLLLEVFGYLPIPFVGDKFMAAVVSGVLRGFGCGLVLLVGGSTGGLDIPAVAIQKRYGVEIGQFSIYVNIAILVLSFFVVGLDATIYGAAALYVFGIVLDNTTRSFDRRKQAFVVTTMPEAVSGYINSMLNRGTTLIPATGGYSGERRVIIITFLETRKVVQLKQYLAANDPQAFMSVSEASEVVGKGFKSWKNL